MWRNGAWARIRSSPFNKAGASAAANPLRSIAPSASVFTPAPVSGSPLSRSRVTGARAVLIITKSMIALLFGLRRAVGPAMADMFGHGTTAGTPALAFKSAAERPRGERSALRRDDHLRHVAAEWRADRKVASRAVEDRPVELPVSS